MDGYDPKINLEEDATERKRLLDAVMLIVTAVFIILHFRAIKAVVGLKGFRFMRAYVVSVVFLVLTMNIIKL